MKAGAKRTANYAALPYWNQTKQKRKALRMWRQWKEIKENSFGKHNRLQYTDITHSLLQCLHGFGGQSQESGRDNCKKIMSKLKRSCRCKLSLHAFLLTKLFKCSQQSGCMNFFSVKDLKVLTFCFYYTAK